MQPPRAATTAAAAAQQQPARRPLQPHAQPAAPAQHHTRAQASHRAALPEPSRTAPPFPSRAAPPCPSRAAPRRPARAALCCFTAAAATAVAADTTTAVPTAPTEPMASPAVLAFDAEGRPLRFDTRLEDLHLFLQLTAKEDISLYDHALGLAPALAATADSTARSQWQTRDAHSRFAIRNSLPVDEREHFGQHKTAQALYTAVVARYSSPASTALGRLSLPYMFPDLSAFSTVADLITHLRTSETRFRAAMPAEFLAKNPPPLWLTLYHLVTRLPDSLRAVRDHFLALCPTELTINLLEKHLLAAETSIVAVGRDCVHCEWGAPQRQGQRGQGGRRVTTGEAVVGAVAAVGVVAGLEGPVAAAGVVAAAAGVVAAAVEEVAGVGAVVVAAVDAVVVVAVVVEVAAAAVEVVEVLVRLLL
ncbi:unnamed protein product [Closterium sp. Naga37s-1]|nr:unnamed protein product [Closterium sp. Naga37s-1]